MLPDGRLLSAADGGVHVMDTSRAVWENSGLKEPSISIITVGAGHAYAGTAIAGVYGFGEPAVAGLPSQPTYATSIALGAAFPNPGRGDIHIPIGVRSPVFARIAVSDVLGREVAILHEGFLDEG